MPLDAVSHGTKQENYYPIIILENKVIAGFFVLDTGSIHVYSDNPTAILLRAFSIQVGFQGKKMAQHSLKLLPDFVRAHFPGKQEVILAVNCRNKQAQYVYQKMGFKDEGNRMMGKKGELIILHMVI